MRRFWFVLLVVCLGVLSGRTAAEEATLFTSASWAHPDGTTHHYVFYYYPDYVAIYAEVAGGNESAFQSFYTYQDAETFVAGLPPVNGLHPHLATITSAEEQAFVRDMTPTPKLFDRPLAAWLGGYRDTTSSPWRWITGEVFDYSNFIENVGTRLLFTGRDDRRWGGSNYNQITIGEYPSFIVEYDQYGVAEDDSVVCEHDGANNPLDEGWTASTFQSFQFATVGPIIDDQDENAWSVSSLSTNDWGMYRCDLTSSQKAAADTGWTFSARMRVSVVMDAGVLTLQFNQGSHFMWILQVGRNTAGDLLIRMPQAGRPPGPGDPVAATILGVGDQYHDYVLRYDPETETVDLEVDGVESLTNVERYEAHAVATPFVAWGDSDAGPVFGQVYFASVKFEVGGDTTPPIVSITVPADGSIVGGGTVEVTITVEDESETAITSVPAGLTGVLPPGGGTLTGAVTLEEGANTITVLADDGVHPPTGTSITVIRDTLPPDVTVPEGTPDVVGDPSFSFPVEVEDGTATQVTCGGVTHAVPAGGGTVICTVVLVEGQNGIAVTITDGAGNQSSTTVDVTLDLTAPLVEILAPADGDCFGSGDSPVPVTASVDDISSTTVVSSPPGISETLDAGGGLVAGALALQEGNNTLTITATDGAGRTSSASVTVILDTTPPQLSFTSPGNGDAVRGVIDLHLQAADPLPGSGVDRVEVFVDGALHGTLTDALFELMFDTTQLSDGSHTFTAEAFDGKGNSSTTNVDVTVDNTAPAVTILAPADGAIVGGAIPFRVQVSDATSGVASATMLAGGVAPTGDASKNYTTPVAGDLLDGSEDTGRRPDGPLTLIARAVDAAGNTREVTVTVTTDNTQPAKAIVTPSNGAVVGGTINIDAAATDPHLAKIEVFVDGNLVGTGSSSPFSVPFDTTTRLDGEMTIRVVATDTVNNASACTVLVTVDNISLELKPSLLNLKSNGQGAPITATLRGPNLAALLPTEDHAIELRVPGGNPIPAVPGWDGDDALEAEGTMLKLRFSRSTLAASIQAGLAGGAIPPDAQFVDVTLVIDGFEIGTTVLRIKR